MAMDGLGHKLSTIEQPATKMQFGEAHDWWSKWKGANYIDGWDVLGQNGTVNHYKQAGFGLSSREATKARENASIIATAAQYDVPLARRIAGLPIRSNVAVWGRVHPSLSALGVAAD